MSINLTAMLPDASAYPWPPVSHPNRTEGESQCEQILRHLRLFGSITPQTALDDYGCFRLAARIADLRKPTRTFIAGYNAGLQQAFKVEVAR